MVVFKYILTDEQREKIVELLNSLGFEGVSTHKDKSLFEYGFVYDSKTGKLIMTSPEYVWDELGEPMKFGIKTITKDEMLEVFTKYRGEILKYNDDIPEEEWLMMCDSYKLNDLFQWENSLGVLITDMTFTSEDLIEYLENYEG